MPAPTSHNITRATVVTAGGARNANRSLIGAPLNSVVVERFAPVVAASASIAASQSIAAAGNALLNGTIITAGVAIFDVPRNVVGAWTTASVITVTGTDVHGAPMVEVGASGATFTGLKAFKTITRISSSAAITLATFGSGAVLGLTYRPVVGGFIRGILNENTTDPGTYVAPVRASLTTANGDPRGTYAYSGTANGTNAFTLMYAVANGPEDFDLFGLPHPLT